MFCIYRHVFRPQETVEPLPLCQLNPRPLENVRKKLSALSQSALLFLCQMLVGWKTNTNTETNKNTETNTNINSQSVRKNSLLYLHLLFFPLVEMCFLLVIDDKHKEKYRLQTQNRDKNTNTKINSQNARTKFCSI